MELTVTRTPLAPTESRGKQMAQVAWKVLQAWAEGPQEDDPALLIRYSLKAAFPTLSGPVVEVSCSDKETGAGDGKKHFKIEYDYVTETDYVSVSIPW